MHLRKERKGKQRGSNSKKLFRDLCTPPSVALVGLAAIKYFCYPPNTSVGNRELCHPPFYQ